MNKFIFLTIFSISIIACVNKIIKDRTKEIPQNCYCEVDQYDCADFKSNQEAQIIYDCCLHKTGYDIYGLDGDSDGRACEWGKKL